MTTYDIIYGITIILSSVIIFGLVNPFWKNEDPEVFGNMANSFRKRLDFFTNVTFSLAFGTLSLVGIVITYFITHKAKHGFNFKIDVK